MNREVTIRRHYRRRPRAHRVPDWALALVIAAAGAGVAWLNVIILSAG